MATKGHNILTLSIESLLNGDDQYVIPVYQRNYAWKEEHISQLIQDIIDYIPKSGEAQDYYIGTLVAYERKIGPEIFFETIDGQQRVTTLTLLTSAIRHFYPEVPLPWYKKINLDFASRKSSSETLQYIYMFGKDFPADYLWNESIRVGFDLCKELLRKKLSENGVDIKTFADYLFNKVKILRVTVPEDTDLNHYFEIMNNRGEQLEKHEILKSKFLELLNGLELVERDLALSVFNLIWEASSNMERYIQYGFTVPQRQVLFGEDDWNTLQPCDFFELTLKLKSSLSLSKTDEGRLSLTEITEGRRLKSTDNQIDEAPERFNSVINFPNFLLHVLRIYTKKDIPLDDKRLISTFEVEIKLADDKIRFAQEFCIELLRCKFLFDKYIIKREFIGGIDRWSLKRMKVKDRKPYYVNSFGKEDDESNDENRSILMLLSMFHVSTPTLVYKHWLNAALLFVMQKNDFVAPSEYKNYLIAIARSFVFDRFLSNSLPKDYYKIIYLTNENVIRNLDHVNLNKLVFEEGIDNIVFNYLDYLLWENHKNQNKRISQFEFSFRSSVEHYYPRHPMPGYKQLDTKALDSFGNLCLISHSKNSRLSNQPPIAKRSHYNKQNLDSIKQWVMMEEYNADEWNEISIADHEQKMVKILTENLDSEFENIFVTNNNNTVSENKAWRWFNQYKNDPQNKVLLARAIMCFGNIEVESGNTNYQDRLCKIYWLYDWEHIKTTKAYKSFCDYVNIENPSGLSTVIQNNLQKKRELQNDPFRYVFVKHPEICEYCEQGYYTRVNDSSQILLHERGSKSKNGKRDLILHLILNWLELTYSVKVYFDSERELFLYISYDQNKGKFYWTDDESKGVLIIACDELGKIKCQIKPNRNASNTSFVQALFEFGWQNAVENYYQRGNTSTLAVLSKEYESDFIRISEKLNSIIRNGLKM